MKVSYELTADDLVAFVQFHQAHSPTALRQRYGCVVVCLVMTLLLPLWICLTSKSPFLQTVRDIAPLLISPFLFLILVIPYLKWRTGHLTKRILSEGRNAGFYGECTLSLDADGIRETKTTGDTLRKWSSVVKIVVAAEHLFIYTSGIEAFVVPRRAFASEDDFNAFVRQIADTSGTVVENV